MVIAQEVLPDAIPAAPVLLFTHVTSVTPTLSETIPKMLIVVSLVGYIELEVGVVIRMVGATVSASTQICLAPPEASALLLVSESKMSRSTPIL